MVWKSNKKRFAWEERIAIRQAPKLAVAHFRLGLALEREGDTERALKEYRRAAELDYLPLP